ncbi:MAG: NYN domain-containing protein [Planctomycetota bacterium]|jgi:predicted RNA-binding protein with PIN domain
MPVVIIDGHNLLRSVQRAGEPFESVTDVQLCHVVGRYLKLTGEQGEVVFDGSGPRDKARFDNISNLEVIFAGPGADADKVIEDKVKATTAPRSLSVVSSDRRLRAAARARKATAVKSEVFWENLQKRLSRRRTPKEPAAKRWGLTEIETEQWLKFFGINK